MSTLVSVVVPALDEEAYIAEAVDSVRSQSHRPIELIVVDDGSTDATAQIALDHGARVLSQPHRGQAGARNAGLQAASGDYWTVFDADDLMPAERLAHQVALLEDRPDLGIVLGLAEAFVTPGEARPAHFNPVWDNGPYHGHCGTVLARRWVLEVVGGYDESLALGEDVDWLARAREAGVGIGRVESLCLRYRIHAGNTSRDPAANRAVTVGLLRASIHRRTRASGG